MQGAIKYLMVCCILFTIGGFAACQSGSSSSSAITGSGVFRDVNLGMSQSTVKNKETATLKKSNNGQLSYELVLDDSDFAYLTYDFDRSDKLQKIQYDVYANDASSANQHYDAIVNQLNQAHTEKKAGRLWLGEKGKDRFSVFVKNLAKSKTPGVTVIYEVL